MKKQINEIERLQKIAGILKENEEEIDLRKPSISIADAFKKAGIDLKAPCVTVDDELNVRNIKSGQALLSALTKRAAPAAESPVYYFPSDIADPAELMGTEEPKTQDKSFKLMVDIVDGGFVEIYQ